MRHSAKIFRVDFFFGGVTTSIFLVFSGRCCYACTDCSFLFCLLYACMCITTISWAVAAVWRNSLLIHARLNAPPHFIDTNYYDTLFFLFVVESYKMITLPWTSTVYACLQITYHTYFLFNFCDSFTGIIDRLQTQNCTDHMISVARKKPFTIYRACSIQISPRKFNGKPRRNCENIVLPETKITKLK